MSVSPVSRFRQVGTIVCIAGATVIPTYISGALTVALPSIGSRIGLTGSDLQWPLNVFSLVNGAFLLLSGGIADGTSRKAVFLFGNLWLVVFCIPLALTRQADTFIALCAIIGLGPAMLSPAATGILSENLPDGGTKNAAFAALGAGQPLGFIVGLFFGGIFAQQHSIIFAVAAGASAMFGGSALYFIPAERIAASSGQQEPRRRISLLKFDWLGAGLSALGLIGLTLGISLAGSTSNGWKNPGTITLLIVAACLLVVFFFWEKYVQRPTTSSTSARQSDATNSAHSLRGALIPPGLWSAPGFVPALVCVFFGWLAFNSLTYYCTLFFQEVQGVTPIQTSLRFLPMVGAGIAANVAGGVLIKYAKPVFLLLGGCLTCAASSIIYARQNPNWGFAQGMLPVVILVVGPDIFFPVIQLFACKTVGGPRAALAGSLFNVTTRLATSIGLAACTLVQHASAQKYASSHSIGVADRQAVVYGFRAVGWFCFASSMVAALVSLVYLRNITVKAPENIEQEIALTGMQVNQPTETMTSK